MKYAHFKNKSFTNSVEICLILKTKFGFINTWNVMKTYVSWGVSFCTYLVIKIISK
jgi:hypothetical protein